MKTKVQTLSGLLPGQTAESEQQHHLLLEAVLNSSAHISIVSFNKNYCYTSFSHSHSLSMKKHFGVNIEKGKSLFSYIPNADVRDRLKSSIDRVFKGNSFSEILSEPLAEGYYEFFWNPIIQSKKIVGASAFIQNITDRKLAELALQKGEELLREGEIFAKFGSWKIDMNKGLVTASAGARRIYGTNKDNITIKELRDFRLPEFNAVVEDKLKRLIEKNEIYDIDFKIKRENDGKIIDVHSKAIYDAATNTIIGSLQDITDRKKVEDELVRSEMLYRSILNASPDGIVITGLDGTLKLVSPAALRIFQYQHPLEVLGRKLTDFVVESDKARILSSITKMFEQSKSSSGEYTGLRRDASCFPVEVNTNFIRNADGEPANLITVVRDISQRKIAEAELAATTEKLKRTAAIAQVGGWEYDLRTKERIWSDETCKMLEIDPAVIGELGDAINLSFYAPEVHEVIGNAAKEGIANGTPFDLELPMITAKGNHIWVRDQGTFIQEDGKTVKIVGVIQNITERKRAEVMLADERRRLALIIEGTNTGTWEWNIQTGKTIYNEGWAKLIGYTLEELSPFSIKTWQQFAHPDDLKNSDELLQKHLKGELEYYECEVRMRHKNGEWIWLLDRGRVNAWDKAGRPLIISGTHQDITARKLAEAGFEESRQKYQGLSDAASEAIFISENGICIEQNKMAEKMFGYTTHEISGAMADIWIVPEDRQMVRLQVQNGLNDPIQVKALRKDGTIFPAILHARYMQYKGRDVRVCALSDITELKDRENEIIRNQKFTEVLMNSIPTPVFFKDTQGLYLGCNKAFASQVGIAPEQIAGKTVMDLWPEYQAIVYKQKDKELLDNPVQQVYETTITDKNGAVRDVIFVKDVFYDEAGSIAGIVGAYIDITEKKRLEAARTEAQERIIKIARQVPGVIYQLRLKTDGTYSFPYISESLQEIFQVSVEEFYADPLRAFKKIHPDDYPGFYESIITSAKKLSPWQYQCRVVLKGGIIRHMYGSSVPEREADGSILWYGFITDITEHKFTEERIRQLSKAVEQSPVSIVITDDRGAIQYVNPKFEELTGYGSEEVLGKNPSVLKSGYTSAAEYKKLWETIKSGNTWRGELHNKKKNGELYWESAAISPVLDEHDKITHFLAVKEDITERVASEQKLQESLKSYEFVNKATSDTIWEWDIKANTITRNENFARTFGYESGAIDNSPEWAGKNIHPDDYERVKNIIDHSIKNKLEHWQAEFRYADAGGVYRYVYDRAYLLFDAEGKPSKMYGSMTDLTEKQKLKSELADQQLKQQKQLLEVNIQAHEEEKSELGKELHDNISQMLATVKMYLGLAKAGRSIKDFDIIGTSYKYVEETITELRKLSHSLVPPSLGEIGLQEALEELVNISSVIKDINVKLVVDKKINNCEFGKKIDLMIYRIVQEQLNNIGKYAEAKNVSIVLEKENDALQLTVSDDGVGFDISKKGKGIGLRNMLNRVEFYSGTMQIITAPGAGCKIIVKIPFDFNNTLL